MMGPRGRVAPAGAVCALVEDVLPVGDLGPSKPALYSRRISAGSSDLSSLTFPVVGEGRGRMGGRSGLEGGV
jgi:hypothetical protein